MHTDGGRSVPGFHAIEVPSLGLSVAEDKRSKNGFCFPIDLRSRNRTDKQVVQRLYVGIDDPNLVFTEFDFLNSVDFVFAAKGGATLSELDGPCSVTVFDHAHPDGVVMEILGAHAGKCAVRLPVILVKDGSRGFALGAELSAIDDYPGDIDGYCEQQINRLKSVKPKLPEALPGELLDSGNEDPHKRLELSVTPHGPKPVDLVKKQKPSDAEKVREEAVRAASKASAEKAAEEATSAADRALQEEAAAKAAAEESAKKAAALAKAAMEKQTRRRLILACGAVIAVVIGWFALSSRTGPVVIATPVVIPVPSIPGKVPGTPPEGPQDNSEAKLPGVATPGMGVLQTDPQAIVVPPIDPGGDPAQQTRPVQAQLPTASVASPATLSVGEVLALYPLNESRKHLGKMLDGARLGSDSAVTEARLALQGIILPPRGDRKAARAANAASLESLQKSEFDSAVKWSLVAVKADPSDQEVVNNLAYSLYKSRQLPDARLATLASLSLAPERTAAWANLASILAEEGKGDSAIAAFLLSHRFSQNKQKTLDFLQKLIQEDASVQVRDAAEKALSKLSATPSGPMGAATATATAVPNLLLAGMIEDGEACMAKKKYDCAIANAKAALRIEPASAGAKALQRRAELEQKKAMESISIQ